MSVLKLSKNDIIRKENNEDKIKLKKSDISIDTAKISGWEQSNRASLEIINNYNNRINKSEWLDEEDRKKYRKAIDTYISTANRLRGINKTFGEGYSDEDEQKWTDSIASMNSAYDSTVKYYSQWIDEKDYKGERNGWFQKSNQFDDGYQFGDITKTIVGSTTDLVKNVGAGVIGMGESALDALVTISPYVGVSEDWAEDFVKKDLYNEEKIANAILSNPVKALTGIDSETDSVFGKKTDSLTQSAGQLLATAGLQAAGVPWWLTTGVTSFGGEAENAFNQGATLNEAVFSGLVSAGAEILTEKISNGISFGNGKTFEDLLPKLTSKISNKVVRKLADLGIDMVGEGFEEVLSGVFSAIGQKFSYASEKEISELFSSEDALDSFIGGAVLGFGGSVVKTISAKKQANKQARKIYGNGADVVSAALDIDSNNAYAQKMQSKLDKGKSLSGGQINRIVDEIKRNVDANESALVSQDKGKIKAAVESRLKELGESGDIGMIADAIVKAELGEKLSSKEKEALKASDYGDWVAEELDPDSPFKNEAEYSNWAESLGTERINTEAYNRGIADVSEVSENALPKTNATEAKIKASVTVEDANAAKGNASSIEELAEDRASVVKGWSDEATSAMVKGYDGSISTDRYATAFDLAYEMGANGAPASKLTRAMNLGVSETVAYTAYELGKKGSEKVESALNSLSNNGIINTNESEAKNENGENIHLRNGGKRDGGKNTERQVSRMEGGSGQAESRGKASRIADSEAARLVNEGREVKVADLGILGGSAEQTVRVVDKESETSSMKEARKRAEARGLNVTFFVGDNLVIKDKNGEWISARAYIKGNHVFVRADHSLYTADQLMRHELGHDMIAKGEVDIDAVRERLLDTVGKEKIDEVAELYTNAYEGSGMSADEIWEECICDSLGDMNIFAGKENAEKFIGAALSEIKAATNETKSPTQTRGSPDGKASRDFNLSDEDYRNYGWVRDNNVISAGHWKTFTTNFADSVARDYYFNKTPDGEFMIEAYNYYDPLSEADVIVFAKGTIESPEITKIIRIKKNYGIDLDAKRSIIYEAERRRIPPTTGDIFEFYYRTDYTGELRNGRNGEKGNRDNNKLGVKRSRSEITANPIIKSEANEDEGTVTETYKNGDVVTKPWGKGKTSKTDSKFTSAEEAKASGKVSDAKFSIEFADDIANKQRKFAADGLSRISSEELEQAIADTAHMVEQMKPYANILPQDKVGKTLVKNGSYDVSVENTTVCIRTLAYNSFVDMVSEKVGRPLTQMESFLVSQKLYEIAKEPQCLYCYVSLDRKAFNGMVIRYTEQRDAAIKAYEEAGKPKIPTAFNAEWSLFKNFLEGRKPTKDMWDRYVGWLNAYNNGERFVTLSDISTEAKRLKLVESGGEVAAQMKDLLRYAQNASHAKKQTQYVAYYDEILKFKPTVIRKLNSHYGLRWYSFSDYSGAFIVENMQQITDAAIRGLKGLSYTKDTDFAEIFAPTGMNINISVYVKKTEGGYEIDAKQSANIDEAIKLRKQYPNVGIVVVATDKAGVEWALSQEWSDVVIPFHTVRTGADVAEFYNWEIFNSEQSDTVADQNLWDAYVNEVGKKKASKMVYPSEHQNNRETYLSICEKRGLTPRFKSFLGNPNYMKLVNETRQSESQTSPLKAKFNLEAAERSFDKFVEKGGYYEGWYNDGIDVDGEAEIVAEDVKAGKKANEVGYGRQDINFDDVAKSRKTNRQHGKASRELDTERVSYAPTFYSHMEKVIDDIKLEKMGTSSILNHLKNRGVKDEEIKWSGIETFLEGKKSVTKAELQEFVAGSQLQIVEEGEDRWEQYTLDGGENYRELVFKLPNSSYSNRAMRGHWGQDAEGILVHARIQDFNVDGKRMLFIEELQSDWHNEGREKGYSTPEYEDAVAVYDKLANEYSKVRQAFNKYVRSSEFRSDPDEVSKKKFDWLRNKMDTAEKRMQDAERDVEALKKKGMGDVADAPFRDNYHEYVLKRLLRMAAEEGYDSIGWTPSEIQSERWSEDYAEAYRIEYDQEMPKFLRKYGKKWGAKVGHTVFEDAFGELLYTDKVTGEVYTPEEVLKKAKQIVEAKYNEPVGTGDIEILQGVVYVETEKHNTYIAMEVSKSHGSKIWSMDITDSMKESVLYEGQPKYSRELDFIDFINEQAGEESDPNLTKTQKVAKVRDELERMNVGKGEIMAVMKLGDKMFDLYGGESSISDFRYGLFEATKLALNGSETGFEAAYDIIHTLAKEVAYNPKDVGGEAEQLAEIKREIRGTKLSVHEADKTSGEFDIYGGYGEFRKRLFGKVNLVNDGVGVDSKYIELQNLYGESFFPDVNTISEQLMQLEKLMNTPLSEYMTVSDEELEYTADKMVQSLFGKLGDIWDRAIKSGETIVAPVESDKFSNRSLLVGALETAAQNGIEKNKLKQYKEKIDLINSEEQKLLDLRIKIKELSFKKGQKDTEAIKNLQFEANQVANRINTYDRQLLNLESTKALKGVLEREKAQVRKREAQKNKETLERYREKAAETQRELMNRYQESRKRGVESRNKTAMRHKIKDVVNELNNYLLKGTKDKHVPIELQKAVAEALDAVNMDTVGAEERIAKKRAEMMSAKSPEVVERIAKEIEHIQEMGGNMEAKISRLKTAYDSIINSEDPLVVNSFDEVISNTIDKVMEVVGETPLRDMSLYQLEAVYDMYRMVLHSIRAANKAFKAKKSEEISTIANRVMEEVDKLGKKKSLQTKAGEAISTFSWNNEKPVYAFERIGSDTFTEVFNNVRAGEDTWAVDMTEAQQFLESEKDKHKYDSWDFNKKYDFASTTGKKFSLTLDQIMSLYAYSKRGAQAKDHLKNGGFVFDGLTTVKEKGKLGITKTYQLKDATAYNLGDDVLDEIIKVLDSEELSGVKDFVDVMQDYLSTVMGEKGNEVSLELYGVKLFKEKNYFPLKSAPQYLERAREQAQGEVKIKNKGFTKETTPKAKNPIVLTSFMDVWAGHVNEMSMYHAFTLALEDFYRVFNYKTPASETMDSEGVISFLENAHGGAAVSYIDQLLKDLNGGARSDPRESLGKALISRFKKTSVIGSLSVIVQQPTALIRAMALVDAKYFGVAPITRGVIRAFNRKSHKALWAEVKKYAPVAVIKEMGYFDTGMGQSSVEWLKGEKSFMDKVDAALTKAPAVADELAWISIWNAVKRETAHKNPNMRTSSEEFLKLCGERFTEVVTKTQVYDSTLAKSANMRSKGTLMNMWTAFMAEPTTTINMVVDAFRKGNKKYIARVLGATVGSIALNAALVSLIYAMRDDDEDETYAEKYLSRVTTEFVDGINPVTYIPFFKDIWSIMQGFDIERADMSLITDLYNTLQTAGKTLGKDTSNMSEEELSEHQKAVSEALWGIVDSVSSLVGIPEKNIRRDTKGIINLFKTLSRDMETSAGSITDNILEDLQSSTPIWNWFSGESKGDKLYDAIISGDTEYVNRLKSAYKDESSYNAAIRKALRENDSRIREAAEAYIGGDYDTYNKLREEIVAEGNFSRELVTDALKAEYNYLKKKAEEDK